MRVLVVYCHPVPESFCAAIRDVALRVLTAAGHEIRLTDLYAEGFDPVMPRQERQSYNERAPDDPALIPHIDNLKWAEAILFIYPTWWYGLPAMLKGWLDRVWALDVVFRLPPGGKGRITSLMTHVTKVGIITTCGAPLWWSILIGQPGRKTILRGMRALCAKRCRTMFLAHYLMDASSDATRAAFLRKVERKIARF
ncbi:MAG: NAD(P)H-dependent oxidoreductase [Rhizobiaceae bacterium]|nr:NAD(P)H-dependent oxidoreductase [Rhizobiaceae bacterium]